jgi:integrase
VAQTTSRVPRVLNACLNWGVAHGDLRKNPAGGVEVTVHGTREVEWFRTPEDFWAALDHIDTKYKGLLHNLLVALLYIGVRVNEFAALQCDDVDPHSPRVDIKHNFDKKRRPSTVKSAESETWLPLHEEAKTAIKAQIALLGEHATGAELVFRGPRGGIITSTLINDALTFGCTQAGLGYRVTAHGLRHSFANWLKVRGIAFDASFDMMCDRCAATALDFRDSIGSMRPAANVRGRRAVKV